MARSYRSLIVVRRQRMAFARLFAHAPKLCVIDESTNGISPDVEEALVCGVAC